MSNRPFSQKYNNFRALHLWLKLFVVESFIYYFKVEEICRFLNNFKYSILKSSASKKSNRSRMNIVIPKLAELSSAKQETVLSKPVLRKPVLTSATCWCHKLLPTNFVSCDQSSVLLTTDQILFSINIDFSSFIFKLIMQTNIQSSVLLF